MLRLVIFPSHFWTRIVQSQRPFMKSVFTLHSSVQINPVVINRCPACQCLQLIRPFGTSHRLFAGKAKNTKRKIVRKVVHSKSIKSSWPTAGIWPNMTVSDIAKAVGRDSDTIFESLLYIPNTDDYDEPDSVIDNLEVLKAICDKTGHRWRLEVMQKVVQRVNKDVVRRPPPDPSECKPRPPVVTIMGHVDHGKTTLLDALRRSKIVDQEFGGITQHIGAFSVTLTSGDKITFLDTPGHAAFSNMRERGAQVTDIVILVVAAEDGVMKQTMQSFKFAQEAGVPVIVAINKIDKHEASVDKTKNMLLRNSIILEEHGGDIQAVPISALKGINLDKLQEAVITLAEMLEIKADFSGKVEGSVIEAKTDPGKGKVATVLVQRGTMKKGVCLVAGTAWAKVRNMYDDLSQTVQVAPPGVAVEVSGWKELPSAGDTVLQVDSESHAQEVLAWRRDEILLQQQKHDLTVIQQKQEAHNREYKELRQAALNQGYRMNKIYGRLSRKETVETYTGPQLSIVLKGDVDGTVEALLQALDSYDSEHCHLNLLQHGVGHVTEMDIDMASSFNGVIYAFNVTSPPKIEKLAVERGVPIIHHNVIYKLIDDLRVRLQSQIPATEQQQVEGEAKVQQIFVVTHNKKKVSVAGCRCVSGALKKDLLYKLVRDKETLIEGQPLSSLKHFKDEVSTVRESQECGLMFEDQTIDPQAGDEIICYQLVTVVPKIEWDLHF